jgi:dTDP-4-amino-4,6-dideoxygalactose transaminase
MSRAAPLRLFLSPPHMTGAEAKRVAEAFASNYIAPLGPQVDAFEAAFAELTGLPHCLALSSGTAATQLALRCLNAGPGDVVIAATITFIASIAPAAQLGAEPAFVDAAPDSWNMDPARLEEALDTFAREGRHVAAVIPTDLYGQCADYAAILALCAPRGVPVLSDSAESVGARAFGPNDAEGDPASVHAGAWPRLAAAVFSFNGNKIITTSGGGMLASRDAALIARARNLSQQARLPAAHYEHAELGYNHRMSNLLAAVGLGQLEALEARVAKRRLIFRWYGQDLGGEPGLSFMPEAKTGKSNRWLTVLRIDESAFGAGPETVRLALEAQNIESRPVWKPMHLQPVFATARRFGGETAEGVFRQGLCLPSGTAMTRDDVARVAETIRAAGRKARG